MFLNLGNIFHFFIALSVLEKLVNKSLTLSSNFQILGKFAWPVTYDWEPLTLLMVVLLDTNNLRNNYKSLLYHMLVVPEYSVN